MARRESGKQTDVFEGLPRQGGVPLDDSYSLWMGVKGEVLLSCVVAVTSLGAAIIIGNTSDMGAMALTVLWKGETRRFYEHTVEEMDELLNSITQWAETALK